MTPEEIAELKLLITELYSQLADAVFKIWDALKRITQESAEELCAAIKRMEAAIGELPETRSAPPSGRMKRNWQYHNHSPGRNMRTTAPPPRARYMPRLRL